MKLQLRSATLPAFEETRPAHYFASEGAIGPVTLSWSAAPSAPARPLPQDTWLHELPQIDASPALAHDERRAPRWLRVAGLAAAALLTLFALGLAASLLDAQRSRGADGREHLAAKV